MSVRSRVLDVSICASLLMLTGAPLFACFTGVGDNGETYDGRSLDPDVAADLALAANDLASLSAACKQAVEEFQDALDEGRICEEFGTAEDQNLATTKTAAKTVNVASDVLAGVAPDMSPWGLVAHEGTHLSGGDGCQALQCQADAACDRLLNDPGLSDSERAQLCTELEDVLNKAAAEGCTITSNCDCDADPESDPVPPPLPGTSVPVPPGFDPHWAQRRVQELDLGGNLTDVVVYQVITASKSLHVLFWVGTESIRRVVNVRMFPLAVEVDNRDPDYPIVYVAGVNASGTSIIKQIQFLDAKNNRFTDFVPTTLFTGTIGFVSDLAFDAVGEDLYLLDDENDKIWVYATVGTPTLTKFAAATDPGFAALASMRTLLSIQPQGQLRFYVDENLPRMTLLPDPLPMCILWDSDADGRADQMTCGTTATMTQ